MWKALSIIAVTEAGMRLKRLIVALTVFIIAGAIFSVSLFFSLFSLYIWLGRHMSDLEASLTISGSLFALAIVIAFIGYFVKNRKTKTDNLASTALIAAPIAAGVVSKFPRLSVVGLIAVAALGFFLVKKDKD
jgi:hypothetical protein